MEDKRNENLHGNNAISNNRAIHIHQEDDDTSITSREICTQRLDLTETLNNSTISRIKLDNKESFLNKCTSLGNRLQAPITNQALHIISSNLTSHTTIINMPLANQPQSLFLQALSKLNESTLSLVMADKKDNPQFWMNITRNDSEITPPDSLTSAPPSYSFVLRQMAVRRRPRLMGTFIPSPSYIQHTPPPNYATAFDIYVDNPVTHPPTRVYNFGFTPMPIVCPECGYTGMTVVASKITLCTHLCAVILCLLCCWLCAPLPYLLRSCKDVYHYCRNCRNYLGMYCPTNPESSYA